jgi:hypothetical protein
VVEKVIDGYLFVWVVLMQNRMVSQLNRCQRANSSDFAFGSVLVAWFLERVPLLCPCILASASQ